MALYPTNTSDSTLNNSISAITLKYIIPNLADQVNRSNPTIMKLPKVTIAGGDDIRQPLRFQRGVQENYSGASVLNTSYVEKDASAIFSWKQKHVPIVITGLDEIKNSGPSAIIDFLESETKSAKEDMTDMFATGIYSAGTDPLEIDGARVFLSTSNTYGGYSQSSNSWWQAKIDSTTTALSLAAMQTVYENCKEAQDAPTFIAFEQTQFNNFWGLLQPQQRFTDNDTAKAGFKNLMFNGTVCIEDSYVPTGYVVFWNMDHVKFISSTKRKFPGEMEPFQKPTDQDVRVAKLLWAGNMVVDQVRKQGAMTALT